MKIHIVCPKIEGDWIIARLARALRDALGWTASPRPREGADWNVFLPYLAMGTGPRPKTLCAGLFTHREDTRPDKVAAWQSAAASVDLRITGAKRYLDDLQPYGVSLVIPYFVDLKHFLLAGDEGREHIGVSGFVYPGGRKGEHRVARLYEEGWPIIASGKGWPCPTTYYPWEEMPTFYQHLRVFLCTSEIEGGPVTVLEALACGTPVVIPRGVGMLDDLPEMDGIYRYTSYEEMIEALGTAYRATPHREALRSVAEKYTQEQFAALWREALTGESSAPNWRGRAGVYMVAYGDPARGCARTAIDSVHCHMPGLPVALASDRPLGNEDLSILQPDADIGGRSVKTRMYDLAPQEWDYVLYLDADTELTAPIDFLFDALQDGWDMVICENPDQYHSTRYMARPDSIEECNVTLEEIGYRDLLQLQGGVVAFRRNERTASALRAWHAEWQRWGKRDQAALLRAIYKNPVKMYVLGTEWNCPDRYPSPNGNAGIVHHQMAARRYKGVIRGRNDSPEAWAAVKASAHSGGDHATH